LSVRIKVDSDRYVQRRGDGGSLAWRRQQLLKIALPFHEAVV